VWVHPIDFDYAWSNCFRCYCSCLSPSTSWIVNQSHWISHPNISGKGDSVTVTKLVALSRILHDRIYLLQVLILVFCGQLVKPESFLCFNKFLVGKRVPLKTIHFPWSMNHTNLNQTFDVIRQVMNAKTKGPVQPANEQVSIAVWVELMSAFCWPHNSVWKKYTKKLPGR
jgi:hypothetical protein